MTGEKETANFLAWRSRLLARERLCPWPGPRPLDASDDPSGDRRHLLVGRDRDRERFRGEVDEHRLVLLAGESGVGKTSLLRAGLIPELEEFGYTVALVREWGGREDSDPASFIASKVYEQFAGEVPGLPTGPELFWALDAKLGGRAVIVLDQFEELIRYDPALTRLVFALLLDLNRESRIKIVVSLRTEYLHRLRPVEKGAKEFQISHYVLDEIGDEFAEEVATAANRDTEEHITIGAAKGIAELWRAARRDDAAAASGDPFHRVGLLHLQALLYALDAKSAEAIIDKAMVPVVEADGPSAADIFQQGLLDSIKVKLGRCRNAAEELGVDRFLIEGTEQALAHSVPHLSSAGYKLVREVSDLAEQAIGDELESLRLGISRSGEDDDTRAPGDGALTPDQYTALLYVLAEAIPADDEAVDLDLLQAGRPEIAAAADKAGPADASRTWAARLRPPETPPHIADPAEVTCGPMSGLAPAAVMIEELRRFMFALAWLQESSLIRVSRPGDVGLMVSLVHDGFGEGLRRFANGLLDGPRGPLHALTAPRGASFAWDMDREPGPHSRHAELQGDATPKVIANLRWRGGWVRAIFTDIVFVNCDFRGTFFDHCVFSGVTFLNCLLDGVIFSDCTIRGVPASATGPREVVRPQFLVDQLDADALAPFSLYRGAALGGALVSSRAGLPAIPAAVGTDAMTPWVPETDGLVLYGGRVSSLVMRSCTGAVSLRYVTGSGFDVVERPQGRLDLFGCTLRHITITREPDADPALIEGDWVGSALTQVWLGESVAGMLHATDCDLVHVWNASSQLVLEADDSRFHGAVNVKLGSGCTPLGPVAADATAAEADTAGSVPESARLMDYRRNPAL